MRNASTSPSKRPPNAVTVPVRRATRPSTASRARAGTVEGEHRRGHGVAEQQLDGEGGDGAGHQGPAQRDQVGGPERVRPGPRQAEGDQGGEDGGAAEGDDPRRCAQADRHRQQGEQGHEPQQRRW